MTMLNKPIVIVADLLGMTGGGTVRAGEAGCVVRDEPGGDVIV